MKKLRVILFLIALAVFIVSGYKLVNYYWNAHREESAFESLQTESGHDLVALHKKNSDCYGWIYVPKTKINYPVMWTPKDPEFYLRRNFNKEKTVAGVPFMDGNSKLGVSKNYLIYGHHIKAGTMFGALEKFEEKSFWEKHKYFTFDEYRKGKQIKGKYEVVAAFRTEIFAKDSKKFKYYSYADITTEKRYNEYIKGIKTLAAYNTKVTPKPMEQLVTLSTCAYHTEDGRFVVVGRKIN